MTGKSSTLRQRLRQTTAEAMLDSAERAMLRKGYERATMAEIAEAAGCATGTFYLYFKNKEELLQAIVARHTKAIFGAVRTAMDEVDDPVQKLRKSAAAHLRYIHDNQPFFRMLFTAIPMGHRSLHQRLSNASIRLHDDFTRLELEIIRRGQKQGKIRGDISAEILQEFMMSAGFGMVEHFVFSPDPPSLHQQFRVLWGLIAAAIGAENGEH